MVNRIQSLLGQTVQATYTSYSFIKKDYFRKFAHVSLIPEGEWDGGTRNVFTWGVSSSILNVVNPWE